MRDNCLVLNGLHVQVAVPVDHSLAMPPTEPKTHKRTKPIQIGVMHWTAAENPPDHVRENMAARGVSIHFVIGADGTIWQFADPATTVCTHAGSSLNEISWGVEVVCYGQARKVPEAGAARETYEAVIHGCRRTMADFYPAQHDAIYALFEGVHGALGLPRGVYAGPYDLVRWWKLRKFRGVIGHLHCSSKNDPGVRPLEMLAKRWAERPL